MPEKKRQYPVRLDISQPGQVRSLPPRTERSPVAEAARLALRSVPGGPAIAAGGYGAAKLALGATGLGDGSSAGTVYHPITGEPRPEGIDYSPAKPRITAAQLDAMQPDNTLVDQYQAIGPNDRYNAMIDSILGSGQPLSIRQLQALKPTLPSTPKPPSAEDQVLGLAVQAIENRYANQQAEAAKLEEAGDTEAADALRRSSAQNRLRYIAGLSQSGFIPFETAVNGK